MVERAVAAAVEAYRAVLELPSPTAVLVLPVYFDGDTPDQLTPPPIAVPRPWEDGPELAMPDVMEDPALNALLEAVNDDWDEGEQLLEAYFAGLGVALHAALGPFVLVRGTDVTIGASPREQLLAQMTPEEAAEWEAKDWLPRDRRVDRLLEQLDIVLSERVDHSHVAVVIRREGVLCGMSPLREPRFARELTGPITSLGETPLVVAGLLPAGAVSASVQDLFDVWHEARVGAGAWLCVLPHEARGGSPPVVFRDAAGAEVVVRAARAGVAREGFAVGLAGTATDFDWAAWREEQDAERRRALADASVPALWPVGAQAPMLRGWGGDSLELERGELTVSIDGRDFNAGDVREVLERVLAPRIGVRAAARAVIEAADVSLPGSIAGTPVAFAAVAASGRWAAVDERRRRTVSVSGVGALPERLDLEALEVDAVETWFPDDDDG